MSGSTATTIGSTPLEISTIKPLTLHSEEGESTSAGQPSVSTELINLNKINFEEYKRAKSEQRDRETKYEIVKNKITTKIKIRAKKPIFKLKSFGRQPKAYDTEVRLKAKRPQTAFMSRNLDLRKFHASLYCYFYNCLGNDFTRHFTHDLYRLKI